ncbi:MAG: tRNA glutamyl-Q(34) synthetase GluQRS [Limimaricola soesokkakensis]|uniref:tRNA glutamyl-Q(34) synthetase GluQRS n=1 Tax=Limimaricola soesokkakensis TaxID=1343159 RepID=UPI0040586A0A
MRVTRFAPSPTGPLHLGHAFSALTAHARAEGGTFLLRIEDIDRQRSKPEWERRIYDDLRWLGLEWPEPVMRQSERISVYRAVLERLWAEGLLYPCSCNRRDILEAASAPQEGGPRFGPDGMIYPGTCRGHGRSGPMPENLPLRLDLRQAMRRIDGPLRWTETGTDPGQREIDPAALIESVGDPVLARRDMGTSYHLAVVIDDADQGVTEVVRGRDLLEATPLHVTLQRLMDLPVPDYHHHRLIRDETGRRLAKRDDARAIGLYRAEGASPDDIRKLIGL